MSNEEVEVLNCEIKRKPASKDRVYSTPDMYLATFLVCKGRSVIIERINDTNKVIFVFENYEETEKDVHDYFNKGLIPAVNFGSELRIMKSRIYSRKK